MTTSSRKHLLLIVVKRHVMRAESAAMIGALSVEDMTCRTYPPSFFYLEVMIISFLLSAELRIRTRSLNALHLSVGAERN